MEFRLPRDGQTYFNNIMIRCEDLINTKIWEGLHVSDLKRWLTNFASEEEKYFAACILDFLIFRSETQTLAIIKQLFQRVLPDLSRQIEPPIGKIPDWLSLLKKTAVNDPNVRLIPVIKRSDPPTKSAHIVLRQMKRYVGVGEQWMVNPSDVAECIKKGIKTYLFIDDFLGTGEQFDDFFKCEELEQYLDHAYMAYVPLAGYIDGISYLQNIYPSLCIRPVEKLDKSHCIFSSDSQCFRDGINDSDSARQFYFNLIEKKGINIPRQDRRGFGHLELAYFFSHATPDNCLPIFWWRNTPSWKPLFYR